MDEDKTQGWQCDKIWEEEGGGEEEVIASVVII